MNQINPNSYPGINATIVGTAGGPVSVKEFGNGGSQAELSIAVGHGYRNKQTNEWVDSGTTWLRVIASTDYAQNNWPEIGKGDRVRLDNGRLETREFTRKDGTTGQSFEVRFGDLSVVEAKDRESVATPF